MATHRKVRGRHGALLILTLAAASCASSANATSPEVSAPAEGITESPLESTAPEGFVPLEEALAPEALLLNQAEVDAQDDDLVAAGLALVGPECVVDDARSIIHEPDVIVEPIDAEESMFEATTTSSGTVAAVTIPAVDIPGYIIDGGCSIEHAAPAGCLGAVDITNVVMPANWIPSAEFPEVLLDGERILPSAISEGPVAERVDVEGASVGQSCLVEADDQDGLVIRRNGVRRDRGRQDRLRRDGLNQLEVSIDEVLVGGYFIEPVSASPVSVSRTSVAPTVFELQSAAVESLSVFEGADQAMFFAPTEALFVAGTSDLAAGADAILAEVAASLGEQYPDGSILVGGFSDSDAGEDADQTLSEEQAQAVANWLTEQGSVEVGRLAVQGYGDTVSLTSPASDVDAADELGQSLSSRVVIHALSG